ncbi:OmpA family protein (plasmid) [Qingshengfaniella alkalisoli]|uniref:OmpA family protein n=2 Tax=Qingshengfaniella alkalisoli TaxID=2599296 RepID=A0A5B8J3T2_9RHOB|nr:OmpA family protein [Qingshengfaniella alkalisoli]
MVALAFTAAQVSAQDFGTVNFQFDSDQLDASGQAQVAEIAERLKAVDSYKPTVVVGYTDAMGSPGYNLDLGLRRARTVANALAALGVPVDRVDHVETRGENELLISVATPERRNRRVTVRLDDILAACRSYRTVSINRDSIGPSLEQDLLAKLSRAQTSYASLSSSGQNGAAFQMAGAAREDCGIAVGYGASDIRKVEYAQRCLCSSARLDVALAY